MKKVFSLLLVIIMMLSSINVCYAEDIFDYLKYFDLLFLDKDGYPIFIGDEYNVKNGGVLADGLFAGAFIVSEGASFTVVNQSDNPKHYVSVVLVPLRYNNGSYYNWSGKAGDHQESYYLTKYNNFESSGEQHPLDKKDIRIISKGESASFYLPDLSDEARKLVVGSKSAMFSICIILREGSFDKATNTFVSSCYDQKGCSNEILYSKVFSVFIDDGTLFKSMGYGNDIFFSDVKKGDYFRDAVVWAIDKEITSGTSKTTFSPNDNCTQAQILTFLWRANGSPSQGPNSAANNYYDNAMLWAKNKGLIDSSVKPNDPCTRMDVVKYLYKLDPDHNLNLSYVKNIKDLKSNQKNMVAWAIGRGITKGTSETTFSPNDNCTRGQIVTFLYRAYGNK